MSTTTDAPPAAKRGTPGRKPLKSRESFERASSRKETALATLREQELRRRNGELVEAEAVAREWAAVLRAVRAGVLAVTSRVRAQLPHLSPGDAEVIDRELRAALRALAEPLDAERSEERKGHDDGEDDDEAARAAARDGGAGEDRVGRRGRVER